ncbi:MAG: MarR family transcriptional regulator [Gemmataceae bacterium]|nr:MarR family transcriptional regulator [Gemmataceae bacterium]MCS7270561.1 MarR family transcriptional regulator [Gemmataceae bacterium]MDW8244377.1 MarR family transcriptional regulator [Thermogemmata sp.]
MAHALATDLVDELIRAWQQVRPDLDPSPLHLVGRILVLAQRLEEGVAAVLAPFGLTLGQFDILATLRRHGPQGGLTPTELLHSVVLSSGGLTARLDGLAAAGLIERRPAAHDRRKVFIHLTPLGRQVIDAATEARFQQARQSLPPLSPREQELLVTLLRRWLVGLEQRRPSVHHPSASLTSSPAARSEP